MAKTNIIQSIVEILNQLTSPEFLLSVLGFYSIFMIMRYKSIYSLFLMVGVFLAPFLSDQWLLGKMLFIFFVPPVLFELTSIYIYNFGGAVLEINFSFRTIFTFEKVNTKLEYILLMSHFMLTLIYLKQALQPNKRKARPQKSNRMELFSVFFIGKAISNTPILVQCFYCFG